MLHMHFEYRKRTQDAYLLTNEHVEMLKAIGDKDIERADRLASEHTRQFRDNFIQFMTENYTTDMKLDFEPSDNSKTAAVKRHAKRKLANRSVVIVLHLKEPR